jgi:hypothetical protein
MKRLIGFTVLGILGLAFVGVTSIHAQTGGTVPAATEQTESVSEATASPTPTQVEYPLPYPGILPDHPMYAVKILRDRIMEFLISDPLRKSEFYLLQSDKRLSMAIALADQGKCTLAESTESKGGKYMDKSVGSMRAYTSNGKPAPGFVASRIETSLKKHAEVLTNLKTKCPSSASGFTGTEEFLETVSDSLRSLPR